jgi:hypothetical protein
MLAVRKALTECDDIPGLSATAMLRRYEWQRLKVRLRKGRLRESIGALARQFVASPGFVLGASWADLGAQLDKLRQAAPHELRHFYDFDPRAGIDPDHDTAMSRALRRLAPLDQAYRPKSRAGAAGSARLSDGDPRETVAMKAFAPCKLDCSTTLQEG